MNHKIVWTFIAFIAAQSFSTSFGSFAQLEDSQNENDSNGETDLSLDLPSIFSIVGMIKGQIKAIVIDLAMQVFHFIRAIAQDIKVRLLMRLGRYTLSDCFHMIFDGVIQFVEEEASEASESYTTTNLATTEKTTTEEATAKKATTEMATTEKTTTTEKASTTTTEASNENENAPENTRSVYYEHESPYVWFYK